MIRTKADLNEYIRYEKNFYSTIGYKGKWHAFVTECEIGQIYRYIEALRYDEYYTNNRSMVHKILGIFWRRRHNKLGIKLGISIPVNTFECGIRIYHSQGIIVHKDARIGKNCTLHGFNCIGNNGKENNNDRNTPIIGDNVDIGVGASIIGNIELADNIKVAAGAVVCKSCKKDGMTLKGIPAKD